MTVSPKTETKNEDLNQKEIGVCTGPLSPIKMSDVENELYNIKEDFEISHAEIQFQIEGNIIDMQMNRPFNELYILPKARITDKALDPPRRQYKKRDMFN